MASEEGFGFDVSRWCDKATGLGREVFLGVGLAALARVKELTPVDTGTLRNSWQIARDGEQTSIDGRKPDAVDPARSTVLAGASDLAAARSVQDAQLGEKLRILNPVVYARAIEHGREIHKKDGTTTHLTGAGMVAQTITELPRIADQVVERLHQRPDPAA